MCVHLRAVGDPAEPLSQSGCSGFGSAVGQYLPGYDLLVQSISGIMSLTGDADGSAYRAGVAVFDFMTGLHAAVVVLAALRYREVTGEGQLSRPPSSLQRCPAEPLGRKRPRCPSRSGAHRGVRPARRSVATSPE
ncbi:MAG: hypothetical protein EOP24_38050 [Hyphomicrobiales bacterium]|nr:MAG: hypothetical protein EOP24_38050 [Hyphomicrobiales bacterium]